MIRWKKYISQVKESVSRLDPEPYEKFWIQIRENDADPSYPLRNTSLKVYVFVEVYGI